MPNISRSIHHDLGLEEARSRVDHFLQKARSLSNLQGEWSENVYQFSVSVQGIRISGKVTVEADTLSLEALIPLIAMPFSGWFGKILNMALDKKNQPVEVETLNSVGLEAKPEEASLPPVLLFLHIPKAAGTTLSEYLSAQCTGPILETGEELYKGGIYYGAFGFFKDEGELLPAQVRPYLTRPDLRGVFGHFSFGIHEFVQRPWSYVTMLRNPVDRALSMYYFLNAGGEVPIDVFFAKPQFKELDNDQTRRIAGVDPELGKCTVEHLEMAKNNLRKHFAVVGLAEKFDASIVLMKHKFGWDNAISYYPRNVTPGRPLASTLPQGVIDQIMALNHLDQALYQYASDLMDEAIVAYGEGFYRDLEVFRGGVRL